MNAPSTQDEAAGAAKAAGVFDHMATQPRVKRYLSTIMANGTLGQAYLFVGPPGSGKVTAAWSLAAAALCDQGGCGHCDSCLRVAHHAHPDVRAYVPDGASGYMVEQIRELVHDTTLAPVRGRRKVYILQDVDRLGTSAANAFLKTLEEPPSDVLFILIGRTRQRILDTVVSRCQVVPFARIPLEQGTQMLMGMTTCEPEQARQALAACSGSVERARGFMLSPARRAVRQRVLDVLDHIVEADDLALLDAARELLELVRVPLDQVRDEQARQMEEGQDLMGKGQLKDLERRQRRELTQREREGVSELLAIVRSWLADLLVLSSGADRSLLVNVDHDAGLARAASRVVPGAVSRAVAAVDQAQSRISYNVSSQLAIEAMLFSIQEELACQR